MNTKKLKLGPTLKDCLTPIVGLILVLIVGSIISPGFANPANIATYFGLASMTILACISEYFIILSGRGATDLSVGAFISIGAALGGTLAEGTNAGLIKAVILMVLLAILCGFINGYAIRIANMPAMIVTMSMASLLNSCYIAITKGKAASGIPNFLRVIGVGNVGPFRVILLIAIALIILIELIFRKSNYGKSLFYIGTNEMAANYCGINSDKYAVIAYIIAAISGALAGFVLLGITASMQAGMGNSYTLLAVASCVIGGVSLGGGKGHFVAAALGACMFTTMDCLLTVLLLPEGERLFFKGAILLLVLLIYGRGPKIRQ